MDDQLIEQIISSDELIRKNIEEANRQTTETFQDQFSAIMSMTSISGENLEKQLQVQGEKEAELIKGNLTQNLSQMTNLNLEDIAETTLKNETSTLSDTTIESLIQVISDLQNVIGNLNLKPTTTTQQVEGVDIENISSLIDDFKSLSNMTWCADWLQCLEKIVEQADVVNKALSSIPTDKKVNIGIDDESLQNVDQSIQKVKENISADINLSAVKEELAAQISTTETQISPAFLNSFSDFNDKISSVVEKIDNNTISTESFVTKISEFSENTISTINTSFSEISKVNQELVEKPIGTENVLQSLESTIKQIETGVVETKPEPLSIQILENTFKNFQLEPTISENQMVMPMAMLPMAQQMPIAQPLPAPPPLSMAFGETMAMAPIAQQMPIAQPLPAPPPLSMAFGETMAMPPMAQQMPIAQPLSAPPPLSMAFGETMAMPIPTAENTSIPFSVETFTQLPILTEKIMGETINNTFTNTNLQESMIPTNMFGSIPFFENQPINTLTEINQNSPQITTETEKTISALNFDSLIASLNNPFTTNVQNTPTSVATNDNLANNQFQNLMESALQVSQPIQTQVSTDVTKIPTIPNVEEILVKSQSIESPDLATAVSKIQTETAERTSDMLANSQIMMSEINFEPLNKTFTSSISNLQDTIKTQSQQASTLVPTETTNTQTDTMTQMLAMLTRLDETLNKFTEMPQQRAGAVPQLGSSMTDSQARMIGRQIASELKDNFAKLYM